jgi:membrane-associated phospholipid phosphatase
VSITGADHAIVQYLFSIRTPWGISVFSALTSLGDTLTIGLVLLCACLVLILSKRNKAYIVGLVVCVAGAKASEVLLKLLVGRARPDAYALFHLDSYSFPSGHATAAMALYGCIAYVLCKIYPKHRTFWLASAAIVIVGIGISRIYLGVHYPSDVLGGYVLGAVWIWLGMRAAKYWRS